MFRRLSLFRKISGLFSGFNSNQSSAKALAASEARNRALIEFAYDAFIGMDTAGNITDWNRQAEKTFGWSLEEVLGKQLSDIIIPERYREAHRIGLARYMASGEGPVLNKRMEVMACHRLGHEVPVEMTIYPIQPGKDVLFGAFLHDISERKQAEANLAKLNQELEQKIEVRTRELTTANRLKDEFLATVSHELRTPLGVIMGYTDMILENEMSAHDQREALKTIHRSGKAQTQIISDLLDVSRIITGKMELEIDNVDLKAGIDAALKSISIAASAKNIQIVTAIDSTLGFVRGDAGRLQQILWNLLSNAVKFTPKNGRVQIILRSEKSRAVIEVVDSGKGIEASFLPYVFERFRQEDATTTRKYGGLGLGLAIVRHLVEAHGGSVEVESEGLNCGARFIVKLPMMGALEDVHTPKVTSVGSAVSGTKTLSGLSILAVEDDMDTRKLIGLILTNAGAKAVLASSVAEGFKYFTEKMPDLVLSDINMPGKDGYEFIAMLRKLPPEKGGNIPAIAFTAHARQEELQMMASGGFDMQISKPADANVLVNNIKRVLDEKNR
jgi:PAS domain S-box-containing protein